MTDERPRPQYGEYATPEQQAAAMGRTYVPPTAEPEHVQPQAVQSQHGGLLRPPSQASADYQSAGSYVGRILTIFLLIVGGLNLVTSIPTYLNLTKAMRSVANLYGTSLGTLPSSIDRAGVPVIIANFVLYALTVLWAVRAIRHGRASVYIPIIGFVVFVFVSCVILVLYAPSYFQGQGL